MIENRDDIGAYPFQRLNLESRFTNMEHWDPFQQISTTGTKRDDLFTIFTQKGDLTERPNIIADRKRPIKTNLN